MTQKDCDTEIGVPTKLGLASPVATQDVSGPSRFGDDSNNADTATTTTPELAASALDVGGPVNVNQTPSSNAISDSITPANAAPSSPSLNPSQLNAFANPIEDGTSGDFSAMTSSSSHSPLDAVSNQAMAEALASPSGPASLNAIQSNDLHSLATITSMPLAGSSADSAQLSSTINPTVGNYGAVTENEAVVGSDPQLASTPNVAPMTDVIQNGILSAGVLSGTDDLAMSQTSTLPASSPAHAVVNILGSNILQNAAGPSTTYSANSATRNNAAANLMPNISPVSGLDSFAPIGTNAAGINMLPPSSLTSSFPVPAAGLTPIASNIVSDPPSLTSNNPLNAPSEMSTMWGGVTPSVSTSDQIITGSVVNGNCICMPSY